MRYVTNLKKFKISSPCLTFQISSLSSQLFNFSHLSLTFSHIPQVSPTSPHVLLWFSLLFSSRVMIMAFMYTSDDYVCRWTYMCIKAQPSDNMHSHTFLHNTPHFRKNSITIFNNNRHRKKKFIVYTTMFIVKANVCADDGIISRGGILPLK